MYKKILMLGVVAAFSTHVWATPGELDKQRVILTANVMEAVSQCKCLANAVDKQDKLFPLTAKSNDKSMTKTLKDYTQGITDMKINANRAQTDIGEIIRNWDPKKNTSQDLKDLNLKVSGELRAFSSFCSQRFDAIAAEIYKRSSIFNRKKIDAKQCGVIQNAKGDFVTDPLKTVN